MISRIRRASPRAHALAVFLCVAPCGFGLGCDGPGVLRPELASASATSLALSDALESLIEEGKATEEDREAAYDLVQTLPANTAGDAFGRAAITGRLAEIRGALSILGSESPTYLATEAEKYALLSRKLDPSFRDGAAARMLGTLYILAPANMLEGGDSEEGLEILETLARERPDLVDNQFRLAEGYIALGDKEPAKKPLCTALSLRTKLRKDHQKVLEKLVTEVPGLDCKAVIGDVPAPAPPASAPPATPPAPSPESAPAPTPSAGP
ncbi:MAG: hypothetical protein HOV80_27860 [Polyangiaceae bacterium]|nr:hypothetical protein [Polyangiaceae bacterium]